MQKQSASCLGAIQHHQQSQQQDTVRKSFQKACHDNCLKRALSVVILEVSFPKCLDL